MVSGPAADVTSLPVVTRELGGYVALCWLRAGTVLPWLAAEVHLPADLAARTASTMLRSWPSSKPRDAVERCLLRRRLPWCRLRVERLAAVMLATAARLLADHLALEVGSAAGV